MKVPSPRQLISIVTSGILLAMVAITGSKTNSNKPADKAESTPAALKATPQPEGVTKIDPVTPAPQTSISPRREVINHLDEKIKAEPGKLNLSPITGIQTPDAKSSPNEILQSRRLTALFVTLKDAVSKVSEEDLPSLKDVKSFIGDVEFSISTRLKQGREYYNLEMTDPAVPYNITVGKLNIISQQLDPTSNASLAPQREGISAPGVGGFSR